MNAGQFKTVSGLWIFEKLLRYAEGPGNDGSAEPGVLCWVGDRSGPSAACRPHTPGSLMARGESTAGSLLTGGGLRSHCPTIRAALS